MDNQGSAEQTVITQDVEIVGTINAKNGLRMDGKLNGDLNCAGDVSVGKSAAVKGNLAVNCATVQGQITGNITAKDRIEMKAATRMAGDIKAKRLTVEDGVSFVGKVEVNPSGVAQGASDAGAGDAPAEEKGRGVFSARR